MSWELTNERSVYLQLVDIIKQKILSGEYKPGEKLPGVRELAAEAAVNPNTMQRALAELERENLLYTQRTNGRFVSDNNALIKNSRLELARKEVISFLQTLRQLGMTTAEIKQLIIDCSSSIED